MNGTRLVRWKVAPDSSASSVNRSPAAAEPLTSTRSNPAPPSFTGSLPSPLFQTITSSPSPPRRVSDPVAADEAIVAAFAFERVVSVAAVDLVGAGTTEERVFAAAAVDLVGAVAAREHVGGAAAVQGQAGQAVEPGRGVGVGLEAVRAAEPVDRQALGLEVDFEFDQVGPFEHHRARFGGIGPGDEDVAQGRRAVDLDFVGTGTADVEVGVVPVVPDQHVVAVAAEEFVFAFEADDAVFAGAAFEHVGLRPAGQQVVVFAAVDLEAAVVRPASAVASTVSLPPPALTTIWALVSAARVVAVPLTVMKPPAAASVIVSPSCCSSRSGYCRLPGVRPSRWPPRGGENGDDASAAISANRLGRELIANYLLVAVADRDRRSVHLQGRDTETSRFFPSRRESSMRPHAATSGLSGDGDSAFATWSRALNRRLVMVPSGTCMALAASP